MSYKFKEDFKGTGPVKPFVNESDNVFKALNDARFIMPPSYSGQEPTIEVRDGELVFDMGDALVFTLKNVSWVLTGSADFGKHTASVVDGRLVIKVRANSVSST